MAKFDSENNEENVKQEFGWKENIVRKDLDERSDEEREERRKEKGKTYTQDSANAESKPTLNIYQWELLDTVRTQFVTTAKWYWVCT